MSFNPVNVSVICEGPTEVEFIKILSRKHFSPKGIFLKASSVGGDVSIDKLVWHVKHARYPVVTTFADYYGFKIKRGADSCQIENALKSKISNPHFIPYLQIHETEALWFSNKDIMCQTMHADAKQAAAIDKIVSDFNDCPEAINNSPKTAPSKRLEAIFKGYEKIVDGKRIAEAMPLSDMISKCPHFAKWLNDIEIEAEKYGKLNKTE